MEKLSLLMRSEQRAKTHRKGLKAEIIKKSEITRKLKIILAKSAGFCFGVRRAVELTEQTAAKVAESGGAGKGFHLWRTDTQSGCCEPAARSRHCADRGTQRSAMPGDYVIIRSHGVPKKIYEELETRGINFIDATCPFVSNIHRIVSAAYERGEQVFIVGNPEHPETIGINGHCGNSAILSAVRRSFESLKAGAAALWFKQRSIPKHLLQCSALSNENIPAFACSTAYAAQPSNGSGRQRN